MNSKHNRKNNSATLHGSGQLKCHCGCNAVLRPASEVSRGTKPGMMAYVCAKYPQCNSYVLAKPDTLEPMGTLAGPELRRLRQEAHHHFDRLFQSGLMTKRKAYEWLSYTVQAPMAHAHIGHLGEYYCRMVIRESKRLLEMRSAQIASFKKVAGGECYGAH